MNRRKKKGPSKKFAKKKLAIRHIQQRRITDPYGQTEADDILQHRAKNINTC
jgi:hypothetical protein